MHIGGVPYCARCWRVWRRVAFYVLLLQASLAGFEPACGEPIAPAGLWQPGTTPDGADSADESPDKPADKPVDEATDSINNIASVDFLCPADLRAMLEQMCDYERNGNWGEAIKLYQKILTASSKGDCVPSEENPETLYVGVREYLHGHIRKYPPEGARCLFVAVFRRGEALAVGSGAKYEPGFVAKSCRRLRLDRKQPEGTGHAGRVTPRSAATSWKPHTIWSASQSFSLTH